jgi:hypothetical protein
MGFRERYHIPPKVTKAREIKMATKPFTIFFMRDFIFKLTVIRKVCRAIKVYHTLAGPETKEETKEYKMKIIFYELNEVPWRVIDYFISQCPKSTLVKILQNSYQYTTVTQDSGELHPWSTWPTVHRGVYNDTHNIRFLNQHITSKHPPLWEILADHKVPVGVFGSLQSWPIPKKQEYRFYVPDTFAQDSQTYPEEIGVFQKFNLRQTEKDGGTIPKPLKVSPDLAKEVLQLLDKGLSFKSMALVGQQLLKEKLNPAFRSIRSIFQAPVAFDFYFKLLQETVPHFSTFFTNHVAGMMHRYWKQAFPQDFNLTPSSEEDKFRAHNILRAMKMADTQLKKLKAFADAHNYVLMIASSMGQEPVERGDYAGELKISHMDRFYTAIGYKGFVKNNLAMNPDFSFSFQDKEDLTLFKNLVQILKSKEGAPLFAFKESGLTLNCNLQSSVGLIEHGHIYKGEMSLPFEDLGITVEYRDQGTGYHQPKGIWIIYHKDLNPISYREEVESIQIAPSILSLFGIKVPSYMKKPLDSIKKLKNLISQEERAPDFS